MSVFRRATSEGRESIALPWPMRGLRDGVVTTGFPRRRDDYADSFEAAVAVDRSPETEEVRTALAGPRVLDDLCPAGALLPADHDGRPDVVVDRGRCILCGACVQALPTVFSWRGAETATLTRATLVDPAAPDALDEVEEVRRRLAARVRRLGRSVHIRHVDAGSDGSDEWEVQALVNPVYDVHRLGIFFTASPRHADILLVTGIGTAGMTQPLRRVRQAMPEPVVVMAAGVDAVSGGLHRGSYSGGQGIDEILDVDVWVPGSPASPFSLLHGLLVAIGRLDPAGGRERGAP